MQTKYLHILQPRKPWNECVFIHESGLSFKDSNISKKKKQIQFAIPCYAPTPPAKRNSKNFKKRFEIFENRNLSEKYRFFTVDDEFIFRWNLNPLLVMGVKISHIIDSQFLETCVKIERRPACIKIQFKCTLIFSRNSNLAWWHKWVMGRGKIFVSSSIYFKNTDLVQYFRNWSAGVLGTLDRIYLFVLDVARESSTFCLKLLVFWLNIIINTSLPTSIYRVS